MRWLTRTFLVGWLAVVLALGGCARDDAKLRIAVIPKGTTHAFWQAIHAGALKAAKERGNATVLWNGPPQEDQRQEQQNIVERYTAERVDAIVLAPCDRQTLVAPVEAALQKDIPVVIIDSGLELTPAIKASKKYLGYIATDNEEGGRAAARHLLQLLEDGPLKTKPKATVVLLPYQANSESTEKREAGFKKIMEKAPKVAFRVNPTMAGATVDSAQKVADNLLRDTDIDAIFAPNESSIQGVLEAWRGKNPRPSLKLIGFDGSKVLIDALKNGEIYGLVLQDPFEMGYQATLRAIDAAQGKLPTQLDMPTRLRVATASNLDDPVVKAMYDPDLSYLKE
jgi:ribose transport system substrate-binding protein